MAGSENIIAFGIVACGCLAALLVGSVLIMRWRAVGDVTDELSDVEKGTRSKTDAEALPALPSMSRRSNIESRGTSGSQASSAGGSARPM